MSKPLNIIDRIFALCGRFILRVGPVGRGRAIGPLSFWFVWQGITTRYYGSKPVRDGGFLRYCVKRYRGEPLRLADGTVVGAGDLVCELHLDNRTVSRALSGCRDDVTAWTFLTLQTLGDDLRVLANGTLAPDVKALRGLLLLAAGARRLGFEVRPVPRTRWLSLVRFFMLGLLAIYNPIGRQRLGQAEQAYYPAEIWLGRKTLLKRYGGGAVDNGETNPTRSGPST